MRRSRGFTLIELLVAMAIVAIIGSIALTGLNNAIDQQTLAREKTERWSEIQLAMRIVLQDLAQLQPRPTRDEIGELPKPSLLASESERFAIELSRGGWSNPAGLPRGTVTRVAYEWEDGTLVRYLFPVMDRTVDTVPIRTELLTGVVTMEVLFLNANGEWVLEWPGIGGEPGGETSRPRAIEFGLELEDYGPIWRVVEVSG